MIKDIDIVSNPSIYIKFIEYNYKFGDLDLLNSGGSMGKSQLTFGIFYDDIQIDKSAELVFKSDKPIEPISF